MAKKEETQLVKTDDGEIANIDDLFTTGFAEVRTLKVGDPSIGGNIPAYVGLLLGEGPPVPVEAPESTKEAPKYNELRTFLFHPVNSKTLEPNEQVKHRVITSSKLAQELTRILGEAARAEKGAIAGFMWTGKIPVKGGKQQMNDFRIFEKYI